MEIIQNDVKTSIRDFYILLDLCFSDFSSARECKRALTVWLVRCFLILPPAVLITLNEAFSLLLEQPAHSPYERERERENAPDKKGNELEQDERENAIACPDTTKRLPTPLLQHVSTCSVFLHIHS